MPPLVPASMNSILRLRQLGAAANRVVEVGVAAVDDDVAGREQRLERGDRLVDRIAGGHHDPDDARLGSAGDDRREISRRGRAEPCTWRPCRRFDRRRRPGARDASGARPCCRPCFPDRSSRVAFQFFREIARCYAPRHAESSPARSSVSSAAPIQVSCERAVLADQGYTLQTASSRPFLPPHPASRQVPGLRPPPPHSFQFSAPRLRTRSTLRTPSPPMSTSDDQLSRRRFLRFAAGSPLLAAAGIDLGALATLFAGGARRAGEGPRAASTGDTGAGVDRVSRRRARRLRFRAGREEEASAGALGLPRRPAPTTTRRFAPIARGTRAGICARVVSSTSARVDPSVEILGVKWPTADRDQSRRQPEGVSSRGRGRRRARGEGQGPSAGAVDRRDDEHRGRDRRARRASLVPALPSGGLESDEADGEARRARGCAGRRVHGGSHRRQQSRDDGPLARDRHAHVHELPPGRRADARRHRSRERAARQSSQARHRRSRARHAEPRGRHADVGLREAASGLDVDEGVRQGHRHARGRRARDAARRRRHVRLEPRRSRGEQHARDDR